jgi:hypothetical protein
MPHFLALSKFRAKAVHAAEYVSSAEARSGQ